MTVYCVFKKNVSMDDRLVIIFANKLDAEQIVNEDDSYYFTEREVVL